MKNSLLILICFLFSNLSFGEEKEPSTSALDKELLSILRSQKIDPECRAITSRVQLNKEKHEDTPLNKITPFDETVGAAFGLVMLHKLANHKIYTSRIENLFPKVIEICNKNSDFNYIKALEFAIFKADLQEIRETFEGTQGDSAIMSRRH